MVGVVLPVRAGEVGIYRGVRDGGGWGGGPEKGAGAEAGTPDWVTAGCVDEQAVVAHFQGKFTGARGELDLERVWTFVSGL